MKRTNFTHISLVLLIITIVSTSYSYATQKLMAGACEVVTVVVDAGDTIRRNVGQLDCAEEFTTDQTTIPQFDPSLFCKSVTHLVPGNASMSVMISLLPEYILDGGVHVISRVLVLNGHVDESLTPSVCDSRSANIPSGSGQVDTLFDNYRDGSSYAVTGPLTFSSTTDDGELTVIYYLVSASDGRIRFRAGLNTRPSPPDGTCNLSCHDLVNISMNGTCDRQVTPADVLSDIDQDCVNLITMLAYPYNHYNDLYPNRDIVDAGLIGQKMIYKVIDPNTGNMCWGYIKVEDKYPPQIDCRNITVSCLVAEQAANSVTTTENCTLYGGPLVEVLSKKYVSYDCEENRELTGYMARKVRATDLWGNFRECEDTIFIWKESIDSVVCPPDTLIECTTEVLRDGKYVELLWNTGKDGDTYLDEQGYAHPWPTDGDGYFPAPYLSSIDPMQDPAYLLPTRTDNGPDFGTGGKCMIVYEYTDYILPTCGKSYKIRRVWDIYDWCTKRDTQCIQWIKITDTKGPLVDPKYIRNYKFNSATEIEASVQSHSINLLSPVDLYSLGNGYFLISDLSNDALYEIDVHGKVIRQVFGYPAGSNVIAVTTDGANMIYLTETNGDQILIFDKQGNLINSFSVAAYTSFPEGIAYNPKTKLLYVVDGQSGHSAQVHVFTMDGVFVTSYPIQGSSPDGIAYDEKVDGYWIYDSGTNQARLYNSDFSQVMLAFTGPGGGEGISTYDGKVYIVQTGTATLFGYDIGYPIIDVDLLTEVDPHDCKAGVSLPDFRSYLSKECDNEITVYYEVEYNDPDHPGKTVLQSGNIDEGGTSHIYLPFGWHCIHYTFIDRCWNQCTYAIMVNVEDNTPPTPVCDEITQVTLDPDSCWARVYAKDLDDGSHDNCCDQLHFAVASMDSITYWRDYWHNYFAGCLDPYDYHHYSDAIDEAIEEWINIFVFDDYIDVTECGDEQLVLRVYEACDVPLYDPHTFYGGEHEWYWWNLSEKFAAWYMYKLDEYIHYGDPRPEFSCDFQTLMNQAGTTAMSSTQGDIKMTSELLLFTNPITWAPEFYPSPCFTPGDHGTFFAPICGYFGSTPVYNEWYNRVATAYPTEYSITWSLSTKKRWAFPHLYNDCMIQVLKDDKQPPVVIAPDDITVYCDGVPYWGSITYGPDTYDFHGAMFAHDVCYGSDELVTGNCFMDDNNADHITLGHEELCTRIPWDGGDYGYYGGDACGDEYGYNHCTDLYSWYPENWAPIYCRVWLWLDKYDNPDGGHPDPQRYFDETTEDWVVSDNCWYPDVDDVIEGSLNECGVGTFTRTMTATDKCGNTAYDHQTLYVKPRSDFEVIFPADVLAECTEVDLDLAATAEGAGYPVISDDDCELIGVTYSDERYDIVDGACYKILRRWKVIDWCVYSPDIHERYPDVIVDDRMVASGDRCCIKRNLKDDGDGYMEYLQVIKVIDENAPVVTCNELPETCIYDADCEATSVSYDLGSAEDGCTPVEEIRYRYYVKPYQSDAPAGYIYGQGHVLEGSFPVGTHDVCLIASDLCGNEDTCTTTFTIRDCKKPTPYCYNGIATVIMPSSGTVDIWAIDLDAGSYDNCTAQDKLRFTFGPTAPEDDPDYDEAQRSSSETLTCDDLGQHNVTIYVWDETGNFDFCETYILVQPGTEACPGANLGSVNGQITTSQSVTVEFVDVKLQQDGGSLPTYQTGVDGRYAFNSLMANNAYEIKPLRDDDPTNGVSTLDIFEIQKHILGLESLEGPYNVIAADINGDNKITVLDLVELRKLVLGVIDELPNNTSWRFAVAGQTFADVQSPWGFEEAYQIQNLTQNEEANFVGIKVGDVNNTSKANSQQLQSAEIREDVRLAFGIEDRTVSAGEEVSVAFMARNFKDVDGYQFTLLGHQMEVLGIEAGALAVTEQNVGLQRSKEGIMTSSWNDSRGVTLSDGEVLFTVRMRARENGQLSQLLQLSDVITRSESYVSGEVSGLNLQFEQDGRVVDVNNFALYQNMPNPFTTETVIGFSLPESGDATLTIMDVTGKQLKQIRGTYTKGYHEVKLKKGEVGVTGVLYYRLENGANVATKKLVVID